jgi:hypothetical protein
MPNSFAKGGRKKDLTSVCICDVVWQRPNVQTPANHLNSVILSAVVIPFVHCHPERSQNLGSRSSAELKDLLAFGIGNSAAGNFHCAGGIVRMLFDVYLGIP